MIKYVLGYVDVLNNYISKYNDEYAKGYIKKRQKL